jgi:hypothetical protein
MVSMIIILFLLAVTLFFFVGRIVEMALNRYREAALMRSACDTMTVEPQTEEVKTRAA